MSSNTLYDAIALVRAGKNEDARQLIFDIIRNDSQNEMAWMWLAETLTSDVDRMKVLKACANINPESKIARMAITKLQEKFNEKEATLPSESPFWEGATFDPNIADRTGHTGAIIGFDGSFILSDVSDFDDVIDLRLTSSEVLESKKAALINEEKSLPAKSAEPFLPTTDDEPTTQYSRYAGRDVPTSPVKRLYPEKEELEFEPDLSDYLHEEHVENNYDKTVVPINRVPLYNQKTAGDENLNDLSIEELGFSDDESLVQNDATIQTDKVQRPYADLFEEDLVEDHVIQNEVEENTKNRKKKERNKLVVLLLGLFVIIAVLCGVLIVVLGGFTFGSTQTTSLPTQLVIPTETTLPTPTWTLIPTVTGTPEPTFTPTMLPTATAIVEISDKAISAANANAVLLKIDQPISGEFFSNLSGNRIAIPDERTIQIWNVLTGEREFVLSGHNDLVTDIVFSEDGKYLVSGARDFSVILWDLSSGQVIKTFGMDGSTINRIYGDRTKNYPRDVSVDFSPDGTTIAAGAFGVVNILDISSGLTRGTFSLSDEALSAAAQDPTNIVGFKVKFNENGWVLAAAMSKNLVGLDTLDAALLYQYELGAKGQVSFPIDRNQILEADTGGITIRNLEDGVVINGFGGRKVKPNQAPPAFVLSETGKVLGIETDAAENEFELAVWNVADDASLMNFKGICVDGQCEIPVFGLFPDDERIIVTRQGNDSSLEVIYVNLISHEIILRITGMTNGVKALAASPKGDLAAGLDDAGILRIWNMVSGDVITSFETPTLDFVEFSRDGQFIYAWDENAIYAWGLP